MTTPVKKYSLLINGEACSASGDDYSDVINPATGDVIAQAAMASTEDVDTAVQAARAAFDDRAWRGMPPVERSKILYSCAQLIMANAQELIELEVAATGGTVSRISSLDIPAAVDLFMVIAEEIKDYPFVDNLPPRILPEMWNTQVLRQPIGVCGLITAWNFPLLLLCLKIAPALATGNTIIVKPSELTPTSSIRLVEILQQVLPPGVLNVINGEGQVVGEAMSLHPGIDKISFTGSTAIGKHIQANCAATMKRCTLELGGKGPAIVTADADMDMVAQGALFAVYMNAGQACESGARLLVHESIHDALVEKLIQLSSKIVVGNPFDPATGMGPMSTEAHFHKVMGYIASAKQEGVHIACGGKQAFVTGCEGGFFVEPTVLTQVNNDMKVAREEIFGPVLAVISYKTEDEALAIANDTDYGLSAGVWTNDLVKAQQLARELRAGSIWINDWHMMRTDAPFGGFNQSGYGRELGKYSLDAYLEIKTISTAFETAATKKKLHRIVHTQML